ncbi:hypothetical protein [Candidatus Uabimicrobium amorphum]|uniref:DUF2147 domain-containing protein n=1 Tax=Uabimicrobium amorphum TaxID=2596890 RepID=A0A5S9ISZ1_UABAM|nr:hypothetical protein [Candidatus Uabimicrobium amorphum]BBM87583.1 hypothetical protein UABAM_05995 [Candidatus Uabimicrobium amorphum]
MKNFLYLLLVLSSLLMAEDKQKTPENKQPVDIIGIWDQYIYYNKEGKTAYHYAGTFQLTKVKGKYQMKQVGTKLPELINSQGVTEIKFDGKEWTFYSDWGRYGVGFFKLKMKKRNEFEGYSYATDSKRKPTYKLSPNRWIRHEL